MLNFRSDRLRTRRTKFAPQEYFSLYGTRKYAHPTNQNNRYVAACIMTNSGVYVCVGLYLLLRTHSTNLYCVCAITSGRTPEQQLKRTQYRGTAAEADAVGKQQLERTQSRRSSVWPSRLVLARDTTAQCASEYRGLRQTLPDGEQVESERSEWATCTGYYSCCTVLLLFCSLLHYKIWIFEYLGGPIFERASSQKYAHPPLCSKMRP